MDTSKSFCSSSALMQSLFSLSHSVQIVGAFTTAKRLHFPEDALRSFISAVMDDLDGNERWAQNDSHILDDLLFLCKIVELGGRRVEQDPCTFGTADNTCATKGLFVISYQVAMSELKLVLFAA